MNSPEPSSPIMWPQPPQPLSEPSGLMSLQLEPVPEMSTIPPRERAQEAQRGQGPARSTQLLTEERGQTPAPGSPPGLTTQSCRDNGAQLLPCLKVEGLGFKEASIYTEPFSGRRRTTRACLLAQLSDNLPHRVPTMCQGLCWTLFTQ